MSLSDVCDSIALAPFNETAYDICCPPQLNNEIGGKGVRISFYLQTLFLGSCYPFWGAYVSNAILENQSFTMRKSEQAGSDN